MHGRLHVAPNTENGQKEYDLDIYEHNRKAWDQQSMTGSEWCTPVDSRIMAAAREGLWKIRLTPNKAVPADWFGDLNGAAVLGLASGGGQQMPILAAAGAHVVSFDLSEEQLSKDRMVAQREGLEVTCVQGNMCDLSQLRDHAFDLIVHPVSNIFAQDLAPVWSECFRVLKPGGTLLTGFMNPSYFLFDHEEARRDGTLTVRYRLPYSDTNSLEWVQLLSKIERGLPLDFGHTLEAQIGGQIRAGFIITGFYDDWWSDEATPLNRFSPCSSVTRAQKTSR